MMICVCVTLLVCMHTALCVPGAVTWRDVKTEHLSDQQVIFFI